MNKGIFQKKDKKILFSSKCESRLPEFIPYNSILLGDYGNKLKIIPKPTENNCILVYSLNNYEWILISELIKK